jgi:hypothetical protein
MFSEQRANPGLARLPTPAQIATEIRRRSIGADIYHDLGTLLGHP